MLTENHILTIPNNDFLFFFSCIPGFSIASFLLIACYNGMTLIEHSLYITDDAIYTAKCIETVTDEYSIHKIEYKMLALLTMLLSRSFFIFMIRKDKLLDR